MTDIQGRLYIGNFVKIHSNCFIPEGTIIKDYVWIYPYVTLINDLYPPHGILKPINIEEYAQIGAATVVLPGVIIGSNSLVGAESVVIINVPSNSVSYGSAAKFNCEIFDLLGPNNKKLYPWKEFLSSERGDPWQKRFILHKTVFLEKISKKLLF